MAGPDAAGRLAAQLPAHLVEAWHIHNRIHLYLLEAIPEPALRSEPVGMKGRPVSGLFAHIHNARLMWLEVSAPGLMAGLSKIPFKTKADRQNVSKTLLAESLTQSGVALATLLQEGVLEGKIKDAKPHPIGFFSYLISHESYHRAEICMTLTEAGHSLPDAILYGMWEWGKR
jgi:uncharacterized damage-inducible protein DinB